MKVWIVVARGVYDAGIVGVFDSKASAILTAQDAFGESDGYHDLDVREWVVGNRVWPATLAVPVLRSPTHTPRMKDVPDGTEVVTDLRNEPSDRVDRQGVVATIRRRR